MGCKWSQVQILSPRPAEGRSIVRETGRAAALVFPASGASHHRLTKPGDVAYRALVRAALRAIDSRPRGGAGRPRRVLRRRRNMAVRRRDLLAGGLLPRRAPGDRPRRPPTSSASSDRCAENTSTTSFFSAGAICNAYSQSMARTSTARDLTRESSSAARPRSAPLPCRRISYPELLSRVARCSEGSITTTEPPHETMWWAGCKR